MQTDPMLPTIHIRQPKPDDVPRLLAVWRQTVFATHDFLSPYDFALIEAEVRDSYLPHATLWVATDDEDQVLGFIGQSGSHVEALFVAPDHQGRGVGRALVRHAAARQPRLTVDVNEQNERVTAFYERLGFRGESRSPVDGAGRPYPLLHLYRNTQT